MGKYVEKLLGQDEQIVFETRLHPIVYLLPLELIAIGVVKFGLLVLERREPSDQSDLLMLLVPIGLLWLLATWIRRATTEIAVTTRRIVYKRGWISRNTVEINFKHIESLEIRQPVLGRILDYGTVVVRGTGIGVQPMHDVARPLELRNATFDLSDHP